MPLAIFQPLHFLWLTMQGLNLGMELPQLVPVSQVGIRADLLPTFFVVAPNQPHSKE